MNEKKVDLLQGPHDCGLWLSLRCTLTLRQSWQCNVRSQHIQSASILLECSLSFHKKNCCSPIREENKVLRKFADFWTVLRENCASSSTLHPHYHQLSIPLLPIEHSQKFKLKVFLVQDVNCWFMDRSYIPDSSYVPQRKSKSYVPERNRMFPNAVVCS